MALASAANTQQAAPNHDDLDHATDIMLDGWQPVMEDLLAPIRAMIAEAAQSGESLVSLQARMHKALKKMDQTALTELIARGQFASHLAGKAGLLDPKPPRKR